MSKRTSFLLVDDDDDDLMLFQAALAEVAPFVEFNTAANGLEALDKLNSGSVTPDLIFLDLNMPMMGGKECLCELKSNENIQHIPVIIYTTSSFPKDIKETLRLGALCFVSKPSDMNILKEFLLATTNNIHNDLEQALHSFGKTQSAIVFC